MTTMFKIENQGYLYIW